MDLKHFAKIYYLSEVGITEQIQNLQLDSSIIILQFRHTSIHLTQYSRQVTLMW